MSIGACIIAGLVIGFLANKFILRLDDGVIRDTFLGAIGAAVIGAIFATAAPAENANFNVFAVIATLAGAVATLVAYHTFFVNLRLR